MEITGVDNGVIFDEIAIRKPDNMRFAQGTGSLMPKGASIFSSATFPVQSHSASSTPFSDHGSCDESTPIEDAQVPVSRIITSLEEEFDHDCDLGVSPVTLASPFHTPRQTTPLSTPQRTKRTIGSSASDTLPRSRANTTSPYSLSLTRTPQRNSTSGAASLKRVSSPGALLPPLPATATSASGSATFSAGASPGHMGLRPVSSQSNARRTPLDDAMQPQSFPVSLRGMYTHFETELEMNNPEK